MDKFKQLDEGVWERCKSNIKSSFAIGKVVVLVIERNE